MRVHLDIHDTDDLELLAAAAEAEAARYRVAAEHASGELARLKAAGNDIRTRAVRTVELLGSAARLIQVADAVRAGIRTGPDAALDAPVRPAGDSPTPMVPTEDADAVAAQLAAFGTTAPTAAPDEPVDPAAAATLAALRAAGPAALGPDAATAGAA